MCKLYNAYDNKRFNAWENELVGLFSSRQKAEEWLTRYAQKWNGGILRTWTMDGWDYFDVGPRVYKIKHEETNKVCPQ